MVDNRENLLGPSGEVHSWSKSRDRFPDMCLRALPHHWVIPRHQESWIHLWWPLSRQADPSTGGNRGRASTFLTHPSIALCILSTTENHYGRHRPWNEVEHLPQSSAMTLQLALPGLPVAIHHKDIMYTFILNIERWSSLPPLCG